MLSYHHFKIKSCRSPANSTIGYRITTWRCAWSRTPCKKVLKIRPGSYQYRVIIDGKWQEDLANPTRVPNSLGGSNSLLW